jgi:hypothetical protein
MAPKDRAWLQCYLVPPNKDLLLELAPDSRFKACRLLHGNNACGSLKILETVLQEFLDAFGMIP